MVEGHWLGNRYGFVLETRCWKPNVGNPVLETHYRFVRVVQETVRVLTTFVD